MKNNDDMLIRQLMQQNKHKIDDNGFTNRVMQHIPKTGNKEWIVLLFGALGTLLTIWLALPLIPASVSISLPDTMTSWYILGGIFCLPLIVLSFYSVSGNRRF